MSNISNNIKLLRKEHGHSQQALADLLGVHRTTLILWEKGSSPIPSDFLTQIADTYNVSIDFLLGRTPFRTINAEEVHGITGLSDASISRLNDLQAEAVARAVQGKPYTLPIQSLIDFLLEHESAPGGLLEALNQYLTGSDGPVDGLPKYVSVADGSMAPVEVPPVPDWLLPSIIARLGVCRDRCQQKVQKKKKA